MYIIPKSTGSNAMDVIDCKCYRPSQPLPARGVFTVLASISRKALTRYVDRLFLFQSLHTMDAFHTSASGNGNLRKSLHHRSSRNVRKASFFCGGSSRTYPIVWSTLVKPAVAEYRYSRSSYYTRWTLWHEYLASSFPLVAD